ncbi:MAG: hypothetical protein H0T92_11770 [Pyrinomonadaceae bacterium]|nr:hypothetical protein [Pyrinomonadaceae bacterium]
MLTVGYLTVDKLMAKEAATAHHCGGSTGETVAQRSAPSNVERGAVSAINLREGAELVGC